MYWTSQPLSLCSWRMHRVWTVWSIAVGAECQASAFHLLQTAKNDTEIPLCSSATLLHRKIWCTSVWNSPVLICLNILMSDIVTFIFEMVFWNVMLCICAYCQCCWSPVIRKWRGKKNRGRKKENASSRNGVNTEIGEMSPQRLVRLGKSMIGTGGVCSCFLLHTQLQLHAEETCQSSTCIEPAQKS